MANKTGRWSNSEARDFIWHDRDIRFDIRPNLLACRPGEIVIDSINSVEDTKGNNGERGTLIVTNLRVLWICHLNNRINLSIGNSTVTNAAIKKARSKLRGHTHALCVSAKFNNKYEFIFTSLVKNSPRLFTTMQAVLRAYESSKLYRDLKLRGSVVRDGELILLPKEHLVDKISGVWNLSSGQGNLGTFFISNIRVVWHATLANNFNVSLPYHCIKSCRIRDTKFGTALVLEAFARSGGYILGFRLENQSVSQQVLEEVQGHMHVSAGAPEFGLDFVVEEEAPPIDKLLVTPVTEDLSVLDDGEDVQAVAAYYADDQDGQEGGAVVYLDTKLGLACEGDGSISTDSLWRVI